jgi:hypothetical protein
MNYFPSSYRLPEYIRKIEKREAILQHRKELREAGRRRREERPSRLGKLKYEEPSQEFLYSEEIPSNLRQIKPVGNPMSDLFNSLQRRNLIEPRKPTRIRRRYALKEVVKPSVKFS